MIDIDDECMGCDAKPEIEFIVQTMAGEEPIDRVTLCTKCASEVGGPFCLIQGIRQPATETRRRTLWR